MLADLQKKFLKGLLSEETPEILESIADEGMFSPSQRFQVYQNTTKLILTDILKSIYPVMRELVGADFFKFVAFSYIKKCPPTSGDMSFYGDKFPGFLKSFEQLKTLPYISDVANLEWNWYLSGMSGSKIPLSIDAISNINEQDIPSLKFKFQPHVLLISSDYAIDKLWQAITDKKTENISDLQLEQPTYILIHRLSDSDITFLPMNEAEYVFTNSLYNDESFGKSTEKAMNINHEFSPDQLLMYFLSNQILTVNE